MSNTPIVLQPNQLYQTPAIPAPEPPLIILPALHQGQLQQLWYEARDASAPKTGPHGTCDVTHNTDGSTTFAFKPISLPSGHSDNVYMLGRYVKYVNPISIAAAKQFTNGVWVKIDKPENVQQLELDLPTPLNQGTMGLAFTPGNPAWSVRVFDYNVKSWKPTGINFDPAVFIDGINIGGEYTIDKMTQKTNAIRIGDKYFPSSFSQSLGNSLAPRLNAAIQLDGKRTADPYTVTVDGFYITLQ